MIESEGGRDELVPPARVRNKAERPSVGTRRTGCRLPLRGEVGR